MKKPVRRLTLLLIVLVALLLASASPAQNATSFDGKWLTTPPARIIEARWATRFNLSAE